MTGRKDLTRAHSIVGFGRDREPYDNYPTPGIAVTELLKRERFDGSIWEPACGSGGIARFFPDCISSDIRTDNICGQGGIDFLTEHRKVDNIITNPPYRLARQFVEHSMECTTHKVAMFLKLVFLESESRYSMFIKYPPRTVYVFSKRLTLKKETEERKMSGMLAYAWFVWDIGFSGKPQIEWIFHREGDNDAEPLLLSGCAVHP
jgi:hypothetical protein